MTQRPNTPTSCDSVLTRSIPSNQATHCSTSLRAFLLIGLVALVTLFYQSAQPSAALAVTPRAKRVEGGPFPLSSYFGRPLFPGVSSDPLRATPSLAHRRFELSCLLVTTGQTMQLC